jgi:6-pyruvoyltetrahydropterin/6-carboxytetrahydropterin synthase
MRVGVEEFFECRHQVPGLPGCEQPHGHSYKVEIIVAGRLEGGMVMDFNDLKPLVRSVLARYHHKDLNSLMETPSCENFCARLFEEWGKSLPNLISVKLWEGRGKWALMESDTLKNPEAAS